jgi:hypothetical protein
MKPTGPNANVCCAFALEAAVEMAKTMSVRIAQRTKRVIGVPPRRVRRVVRVLLP